MLSGVTGKNPPADLRFFLCAPLQLLQAVPKLQDSHIFIRNFCNRSSQNVLPVFYSHFPNLRLCKITGDFLRKWHLGRQPHTVCQGISRIVSYPFPPAPHIFMEHRRIRRQSHLSPNISVLGK